MRVLFTNPPWWEKAGKKYFFKQVWRAGVRSGSRWPFTFEARSSPDHHVFGDYAPYPFFMGYAATYAREKTGADVVFRDSIATRESFETYYGYLSKNHFDYIFIESATPSWLSDLAVIREIQRLQPKAKIVLTGPMTSQNPQKLIDDHGLHAAIKGEYEKNSVKVLNGGSGVFEHDLLTKEEMNAAPFPYYDKEIAHRYADYNPRGQIFPHAHVLSSRGCPYKCIFCVWPSTMTGNDPDGTKVRTVRHYTAEYMEEFLGRLIKDYGFKSIYFDDDTFNLGNSHVVNMTNVMKKLGVPWSAMCRADTIKMETWKLMKDSGCFGVKLGFESGSQYVVDKIVNKHLDLEYAASVVRHLHNDLGMTVHGTFTYGLPGETKEQMLETKAYIAKLPFDSIQESGTAEIEGTPLHTLRQKGQLEKYAGANMDQNYKRELDGNKKYISLASELQEK